MSRRQKLLLFIVLPSLLLVLLLAVGGWVYGPELQRAAVDQLNRRLKVPVQVQAMDVSLWRKFPYASIHLEQVVTKGSPCSGYDDVLLDAGHVYLQFSWWDLLTGQTRLRRLDIEDARCHVHEDRTGRTNTDIFRDSKSDADPFSFELSEIRIRNSAFEYASDRSRNDMAWHIRTLDAKGRFSQAEFTLGFTSEFRSERCLLGAADYLPGKDISIVASLNVNRETNTVRFERFEGELEGLSLAASGEIGFSDTDTRYDLQIEARNADLRGLLAVLPGSGQSRWKDFSCSGKIDLNLTVDGISGKHSVPRIVARFGARSAGMRPPDSPVALEGLSFAGTFSNRDASGKGTESLVVTDLRAVLAGQPVRASFSLRDFNQPRLDLQLKARLNLEALARFYSPDTVESMRGELDVDARMQGQTGQRNGWVSAGTVKVRDVAFRLKGSPVDYNSFSGDISLSGERLTVRNLGGRADGSDFRFDGYFDHVYAAILSTEEEVSGQAKLVSRNLDLNELLEEKGPRSAADTAYRIDLSDRVRMNLDLDVGILTFRKFQAWQVRGRMRIADKVLTGEGISFKAFDGHLTIDGSMNASSRDSLLIACDVDVRSIDVTELFVQMGNFGQTVMTDRNVKGKLTADIRFASTWGKDLGCNYDRIYAQSTLRIDEGELNNFEPLLAVSRYVKGADLNRVRFNTLQNTIEIRQRKILIPAMQIRSSVLDLTASGTHGFDNVVDYSLELYLSQLINRKVRERNTEFGTIEDDGNGGMRLFLTMRGPLDNPTIKFNRKGVEQKIVNEIRDEKKVLKQVLKEEFGWFRRDSTLKESDKRKDPPKRQELELDLDPE